MGLLSVFINFLNYGNYSVSSNVNIYYTDYINYMVSWVVSNKLVYYKLPTVLNYYDIIF